ncbi:MAG: hypothetical protein ACKOW3_08775 [Hyphomicrobium sp.]
MINKMPTDADDRTLEYYKDFKNKLISFLVDELEISSEIALKKSQSLFKTGVLASAACAGYDLGLSQENALALMISVEGLAQRQEARKNLSDWFFLNQERENRQLIEQLITATVPLIETLPDDRKFLFEKRFSEIRTTFS